VSYVDAGGVHTWYDDYGTGRALVLLHGGFSDASEFGANIPALAERFRVLTPERRGHGHTPDIAGPISYDPPPPQPQHAATGTTHDQLDNDHPHNADVRTPRRRARWCRSPADRQWRSKMTATLKMTHKAIGVEVRRGTYDIVVDGQRAGSVEMNGTIEIPVEPGRHTLQIRSGRNSSRTQTFEAAESQTVAFRCTGKSFLPIFLASFVVPSLALRLRREADDRSL
jgi:hypothetical protein